MRPGELVPERRYRVTHRTDVGTRVSVLVYVGPINVPDSLAGPRRVFSAGHVVGIVEIPDHFIVDAQEVQLTGRGKNGLVFMDLKTGLERRAAPISHVPVARGYCLWCRHPKAWHTGVVPQAVKEDPNNRNVDWTTTACAHPACLGCRRYER